MSLALLLTQQCGSRAKSNPSEGLFQRPKRLLHHHRLTLQHTAPCAPGSVCPKKPPDAGLQSHPSQSTNNSHHHAKAQPHRLSIYRLLLKGTACTGPGHSDTAVPFPHHPLCSPLICVHCGPLSEGRDFTGTRETGVTTFKAPASSFNLGSCDLRRETSN